MKASVSLEGIWILLQSLSRDNKKWLADKLYEDISHTCAPAHELSFPHIASDYKPNPVVLEKVADRLPVDIDIEAERQQMWEEWSR